MPTRDLSALFGATIDYPGVPSAKHPKGKTYRVRSVDAATGAKLTAAAALGMKLASGGELTEDELAATKLDDDGERELYRTVLGCRPGCVYPEKRPDGSDSEPCGSTYCEMTADGVLWTDLQYVAQDVYMMITDNRALADLVIATESAGAGEAEARGNRASRRAAQRNSPRKASSSSNRASGATQAPTRARASTRTSSTSGKATATG